MFRLIAREIQDHSVYFGICCIVSALIVALLVSMMYYGITEGGVPVAYFMGGLLFLGFGIFGAAQMYADRANRISTLLSTQAVTRNRILVARITTGIVTVVIALIPVFVATVILLKLKAPPLEFYSSMVRDISIVLALTAVAFHAMGLLVGWTSSRVQLLGGFLGLMLLLGSSIVVKGFGPSAMALLGVFILAVWAKVWHTFTSTSL